MEDRLFVWNEILEYIAESSNKVMLLGDFNQVEMSSQKLGGSSIILGKDFFMGWRHQWNLT